MKIFENKESVKKTLLLLCFLTPFFSGVFAQSLDLYDYEDRLVSNDTLYYQGGTNDNLLEMGLKVTNKGPAAINVKVKKEEISIVEDTENYFCWKDCYLPSVFVSPTYLTIEPGETNDSNFKGDYKSHQNSGESKIRYTFFNVEDAEDTATVLVVFSVSTLTKIHHVDNSFSNPYPVPAKEFVKIKYNLDKVNNARLEIYNLQGMKTEEKLVKQRNGEFVLFSENYKPGIYLYFLTQNGQFIDSGKFVFQY